MCFSFIKIEDISMDAIINYGEKAETIPFVGKPEEKLDSISLRIFYQNVSGSVKCVTPENLPPTSHLKLSIKFKYGKVEQSWLQKSGVGLLKETDFLSCILTNVMTQTGYRVWLDVNVKHTAKRRIIPVVNMALPASRCAMNAKESVV